MQSLPQPGKCFSLIGTCTTEIAASVNSTIPSVTKDYKRQFYIILVSLQGIINCVKPREGCFYLHCCAWVHKVFKNLEATSKFYAPVGYHEASSILDPYLLDATVQT